MKLIIFSMTGHSCDSRDPKSWYNVIDPDHHAIIDKGWATLLSGENSILELRLKRPFITGGKLVGKPDSYLIISKDKCLVMNALKYMHILSRISETWMMKLRY